MFSYVSHEHKRAMRNPESLILHAREVFENRNFLKIHVNSYLNQNYSKEISRIVISAKHYWPLHYKVYIIAQQSKSSNSAVLCRGSSAV